MRLLQRLRDHVARRHLQELAVVAGERLLHEHARDGVERLVPLLALGGAVDEKPPSSASEDDSPVPNSTRPSLTRSRVAMRSADPGRVVEPERQLHDAVAEPNAAGALAAPRRGTPRAR